ncbi:cation transporter, partial [Sphingobacterium multivorum]|uniref:cation transporter n=1 Tax=Sphingobacterium multivorum TaxID=28454 RepID=UPI002FDD7F81
MQHHYTLSGMSCDGCRSTIEHALNELPGVHAEVTLNPPSMTVTSQKHIPLQQLQEIISKLGPYQLSEIHKHQDDVQSDQHFVAQASERYGCPMHCEGEKTYSQPGNCPICGMHLVKLDAETAIKNKLHTEHAATSHIQHEQQHNHSAQSNATVHRSETISTPDKAH